MAIVLIRVFFLFCMCVREPLPRAFLTWSDRLGSQKFDEKPLERERSSEP